MLLALRQYGPAWINRWLWDRAFSNPGSGWHQPGATGGDFLYPVLDSHLHGGSLLDLGCGLGTTAAELPPQACTRYVGVDVSPVAIAKARARHIPRTTFDVGAIETYVPADRFAVILFRESLYYLAPTEAVRALHRYQAFLITSGVFVIRICDRVKHRDLLAAIEREAETCERVDHPVGATIVILRSLVYTDACGSSSRPQ